MQISMEYAIKSVQGLRQKQQQQQQTQHMLKRRHAL
jgi:hypothetical protein